jgi:hypothetical protein
MLSKNIKNVLIITVAAGTILNTINSYDVIWESNFTFRNVLRIVLTYITPFCVSLYSSALASNHSKKQILKTQLLKSSCVFF